MGYYTNYTLEVKGVESVEEFGALEKELDYKDIINTILDEGRYYPEYNEASFLSYNGAKWYEHDSDMVEISKNFPEMTFMLEGEGEERDDLWRCFYKNGDYEYCGITLVYEEPSEIKWD